MKTTPPIGPIERPGLIATLLIISRLRRIAEHLTCGSLPHSLSRHHADQLREIADLLEREAAVTIQNGKAKS